MASGNTLLVFSSEDGAPPSSAFAGWTRRNNHIVAAFDAATDESLDFRGVLPKHYAGGGLTILLHWIAASATTGTCRWSAAMERLNTDMDSDSFATAQTAGGTANGTSGIITTTSITMSSGANMDSLAAGEAFRLRISRDADGTSGTDDMTGDAQLVAVEIRET